jgi:aspartyl-tRNA(Asn)/glutamyl-tRNA(Gln) amidotransferase subunit A
LKLTYRSLPYDGYSGLNSTMSAPGVFGRDAADARLLAEVLLGRPLPTAVGKSLRVGVVRRPFWDDIDAEVEAACQGALAAAGWEVVEIEIPHSDLAAPAGAVRAASELVLVVPPAVVSDVSALTRGMVQYVALQPATRLLRADRARAALRRDLVAAFTRCDVLAWPTNPAPAPPIATPVVELPSGTSLPDAPNMRQAVLANLTGVPGISVPVGVHSSGLPMGLQLLAGWGQESVLLDAAGWVEEASDRRWVDAIPTP